MLKKLNTKHAGFTLVEIMIVVAIIALLAAIAVPNFLRSRKRSQATVILEDFRIIDAAIDQYAIETGRSGATAAWNWTDLSKYVKNGTRLYDGMLVGTFYDILGGQYLNSGTVDVDATSPTPRLYVDPSTFNALSDVAPASFWSPYIQ